MWQSGCQSPYVREVAMYRNYHQISLEKVLLFQAGWIQKIPVTVL